MVDKNYLSISELISVIKYVSSQMIANEDYLNNLDSKIGDGDHGRAIAYGFREVLNNIDSEAFNSVEELFIYVGNTLLDTMGGASGVLFGTLFISGSINQIHNKQANLELFCKIFDKSLATLKTRGKAEVGDKTMIDALAPAVDSLRKSVLEKKDLSVGFDEAAKSAKKGMEATKNIRARVGRARYYSDTSIGNFDPGAASTYLIFNGFSEGIKKCLYKNSNNQLVVTVSMNPCIDRTINIDSINSGATHKVNEIRNDVSGKGINVSIALKHFGVSNICVGFNYSNGMEMVDASLKKQGIDSDFVIVNGELRTNIKIFEKFSKIMTEFNEYGRMVDKEHINRLNDKIIEYLDQAKILVLDGSVPKGVPDDIYKSIIDSTKDKNIYTILDASGNLLLEGIKAKPFLIKPNIDEFKSAFDLKSDNKIEIVSKAREIIDKGVRYVCISLGREGALLVNEKETFYAKAVDVDVKGIQGAGDSMVAGFCMAIINDMSAYDMLKYAMAAAAGSLQYPGTQICTLDDLERLKEMVKIQKLKI